MAKLTMPRLGETMEQGTVRAWLIKPGVPFKRGDVIAEIETDKTVVELPALDGGTVERFVANEGDVVEVGGVLAELVGAGVPLSRVGEGSGVRVEPNQIGSDSSEPAAPYRRGAALTPDPSPTRERGTRPLASPAARKLAKKQGIDLTKITGTGRQGRIQGWDVRNTSALPASAATAILHASERGEGNTTPLILLHGFGGDKDGWLSLSVPLAQSRKVISFDLPGHGGSLAHPARDVKAMAVALLAQLQQRGIRKAHFVGHSMGGAVALSAAIQNSDIAQSLTLFAPGGIGPGINARLLTSFAAAKSEAEIAIVMDQFFGRETVVPRGLAAAIAATRQNPAVVPAMKEIAASMFHGAEQRMVSADLLAALSIPTRVVWGEDDHVLPVSNAAALPGVIAVHRYSRVGHMPQIEIGRDAIRLTQLSMGTT